MKIAVTVEIDATMVRSYSDEHLAVLWHVAQANPAPFDDKAAGEVTECLALEIVRRWLGSIEPETHNHKASSYYWTNLRRFASYLPGDPSGTPEGHEGGTWVSKVAPATEQDGSTT